MTATATRNRWVVCEDYAIGPFTQPAADARLASIQADSRACRLPHHIVVSDRQPKPSAPAVRSLAELRAEWDAPFLADPFDEAANAARSRLTRDLAGAILAADLWNPETKGATQVGDLYLAGAGWSKERGDQADATAERGTPEWAAALGRHEHVTLSGDGKSAIRDQWCQHAYEDALDGEWVRYEYWTERGCEAHGFVHADIRCRRLLQTG